MNKCRICNSREIVHLIDLGLCTASNRYLKSISEREEKFQLKMGLCKTCGLVQLTNPFPEKKLHPIYNWVTYNEPEQHLDKTAEIIAHLPSINLNSSFCGLSFKDDSLLERLKKKGFKNIKKAKEPAAKNGKYDVVISRHILEHAYNIKEFISALKEMATPSGYILFEVPDCTKPMELFDYSMPWEEHLIYLTPETYKNSFSHNGLLLERFELFQYPMENSLIAIASKANSIKPKFPFEDNLKKENERALNYAAAFNGKKDSINLFFSNHKKNDGKIAVFGAGHTSCMLLNLFGINNYIECVIDDNPNKQGMFMPCSHLPIISSPEMIDKGINLAVLSVNPEIEEKIIAKNHEFLKRGGKFLSFSPVSPVYIGIEAEPAKFNEITKEVFYTKEDIISLDKSDIAFIKSRALNNIRQRSRICCHKGTEDILQEMFIILKKGTYIRPHKHINKPESFHVIEGLADIILFDEAGNVLNTIKIGDYSTGRKFYYRLSTPLYHTVYIKSDHLTFHETTMGPFIKEDTIFASWAPLEEDLAGIKKFMDNLSRKI